MPRRRYSGVFMNTVLTGKSDEQTIRHRLRMVRDALRVARRGAYKSSAALRER